MEFLLIFAAVLAFVAAISLFVMLVDKSLERKRKEFWRQQNDKWSAEMKQIFPDWENNAKP